ncbi:MlaD family protein [Nocardia cyriacigeorgica]|uniref:MlaD family protein n=1 Tax=Nocardia cyriacigeorgica TaxID=135487 RepID=UPI002456AE22|nr:MlaD family protein [Nocardia cyriacigeorgica]
MFSLSVFRTFSRGRTRTPAGSGTQARTELAWGVGGIGVAMVLVIVIGMFHLIHVNETVYRADLFDAGAVREGDEVRIAGIAVGRVKSLVLTDDKVRMEFAVDSDVFVGSTSTMSIRMLTVVGGAYVALAPAGSKPLGDAVIPAERVSLPYNLSQLFQDATDPVRATDGSLLRANLEALTDSLNDSPGALTRVIDGMGSVVDILDRQNADVSRTLAISDEYLTALAGSKSVLVQTVHTLTRLERQIADNKIVVGQTLAMMADTLARLAPIGRSWDSTASPALRRLQAAMPKLEELHVQLEAFAGSLSALEARILPLLSAEGLVTVDDSDVTMQGTAVCVPIPGRPC